MSDPSIGLLGFALSLLLILVGVPVAIALGITGVFGFAFLNGFDSAMFILGSGVITSYSIHYTKLYEYSHDGTLYQKQVVVLPGPGCSRYTQGNY